MAKLNPLSFQKFYDKIQFFPEYWKSLMPATDINSENEEDWISRAKLLDEFSAQNNVVVFLKKTFTNRFIYISNKLKILGGYDPALFMAEDGLNFSFSNLHPNHLKGVLILNEAAMKYGINKGLKSYDKLVLSINYLTKDAYGKYLQILQQFIIVDADENMQPKLILSFAQNVSHIKKENSLELVASSPAGIEITGYNIDQDCLTEISTFSTQEKKILKLLSEGFESKKIGDTLNISRHTVDTHRRKLINKTNCIDTTAVVAYARMINLI